MIKKEKELFKTYLSSTVAVDSSISEDNKYMSFGEVNTSGDSYTVFNKDSVYRKS